MAAVTSVYDSLSRRLEAAPAPGTADLWQGLETHLDFAELQPKLAPDVEVKSFKLRWGNDYTMIANPRDILHLRLSPSEAAILPFLDGTHTVKEIVVDRLEESGELELSGLADLIEALARFNFLEPSFVDAYAAVARRLDRTPALVRGFRNFARTLQVEWSGAERFAIAGYRHGLKWTFNRWVALLFGIFAIVGFAAFVALYRSHRFPLAEDSAAAESVLLIAMNYFLTFVHETAHALVLVRYGRRVKSAGFGIYFGSPSFFIESSDGLMLDRRQRILQSFAGPYSELIVAGAGSLIAWSWPAGPVGGLLYRWALLNYFVIFLNLVPLLELDGYWILADTIQVPDLRPRSLEFIRYELWRKLRRREGFTKQEVGLGLYGTVGVAFTIFVVYWAYFFWRQVFGGLISALWNAGIAGRVLLVLLALFVTGPLLRAVVAFARSVARAAGRLIGRVRFRLERDWRVEAALLIDDIPIFDDLPEDALSDLAGRVRLRRVPRGKPIVRQGERADAFFVVRSGTFEIVEEDAEGDDRVIRVLSRGESFGEVGLATSAPRAATVRAATDGQLFEIDESTFDRLLADSLHLPEFAPTVQRLNELRALPAFEALEPDEAAELLGHGDWVSFPPDETIVVQGATGDAFYAIVAGQVDVFEDDSLVRTMGPGQHFGEIALLHDVPRTASVVSKTPVRAFRLDREGFDRVVADSFRKGTIKPSADASRTWHH